MTPGDEGDRRSAPRFGHQPFPPASRVGAEGVAEALSPGPEDRAQPVPEDAAGVLFLLQRDRPSGDPVLLLTKRSARVRQPGDLCCPGGSRHRVDDALGFLFRLPGSPLRRSPGWGPTERAGRHRTRIVSRYWACALRETWEETGLSPFGIRFLGALPVYRLVLFRRAILPLVGWVEGPRRFRLNWEVESLLPIPLAELLDPRAYAVYRLELGDDGGCGVPTRRTFPCFLPRQGGGGEVLWGATYFIAVSFLERVFGFRPPPEEARPAVAGELAPDYSTGSGR